MATTTGDLANTMVTQSGNWERDSVTWLIPTPKAAANPTIEVFLWFISPVDTSFIPVDGGEYGYCGSSQNALGNSGEKGGELGDQTCNEKHKGSKHEYSSVDNLRGGDYPYVL